MAHKKHPVFRILFALATATSFLLCVTVGLQITFQRDAHIFGRVVISENRTHTLEIATTQYALLISQTPGDLGAGIEVKQPWTSDWSHRTSPQWIYDLFSLFEARSQFAGFGYFNASSLGAPFWSLRIPHWFAALLFAILPTIWLIRFIRRRRIRHSRGFDVLPPTHTPSP